jgi:hypothetical protein
VYNPEFGFPDGYVTINFGEEVDDVWHTCMYGSFTSIIDARLIGKRS